MRCGCSTKNVTQAHRVPTVPGATVSEDELIEHCRAHLAHYKRPRHVVIVDCLPRNANGKLMKVELRKLFVQPVA